MAEERKDMPREEPGHMGGENQGKENKPGNFATDREKTSEAGRKGGEESRSGGSSGGQGSQGGSNR